MASRIDPKGQTELVERRTRHSKSFQLPGGQIRVVNRIHPVHWDNAGTWREVDDGLVSSDGGITWTTPDTPYQLLYNAQQCELSYRSKKGGDFFRVRLVGLDDTPVVTPFPLPTLGNNWHSLKTMVAPELEIELRVRSHEVELFKILHGPSAPTSLRWKVVEGDSSQINFDLMNTRGGDNMLALAPRIGEAKKRRIEMTHVRTADDLNENPGKKTYVVTETFTGRTQYVDPNTSARSWVNEREYPIEIDVTVSESVVANDDDGHGNTAGTYWNSTVNNVLVYTGLYGAFRFQTVNVPQGQTLDSAILTYNRTGGGGATGATLAGHNVDDAPNWPSASSNSPATMAATTANITVPIYGSNGIKTEDVKTICQEIVNRAGWVANNNMRLGFTVVPGTRAAGYQYFEDYQAAGTAEAELEIIYTVDAGGAPGLLQIGRQLYIMP